MINKIKEYIIRRKLEKSNYIYQTFDDIYDSEIDRNRTVYGTFTQSPEFLSSGVTDDKVDIFYTVIYLSLVKGKLKVTSNKGSFIKIPMYYVFSSYTRVFEDRFNMLKEESRMIQDNFEKNVINRTNRPIDSSILKVR